ncbi:MAG: hydroxymethylbilane synthase [Gemmatimonadaceae bacterium]
MNPATSGRALRIGSRGSRLALVQSAMVREALLARHPYLGVTIVPIMTRGDQLQDRSIAELGEEGVFFTAIEEALREGQVDLAVHSTKDLPTAQPDDLRIAACLPRADARDVLVSRRGGLQVLPPGSRVGTSSASRSAQLLAARADLIIAEVRGNVDTRLGKLAAGEYDALVLAAAGLVRLGLVEAVTEWLSMDVMVPAPGQGALAVQVRAADEGVGAAVASLDDAMTTLALAAERAFLAATGAGCTGVVGAYARVDDSMVELTGLLGRPDGTVVRGRRAAPHTLAATLGTELAMELLAGSRDAVTVTQTKRSARA